MNNPTEIKLVPLGGLGEIGKNCMVVESAKEAFLIDCGLMFPEENVLGADIAISDFSYLRSIRQKLKGLILTHGHEDHIGAIPYLLREFSMPIWGSSFTIALVREKLKEFPEAHKVPLNVFKSFETISLNDFQIECLPVSHSIVDAYALNIDTPVGKIIHSGDFKDDPTPIKNVTLSIKYFKRFAKENVLLFMCDSTNVETPGHSHSEKDVASEIEKIFKACRGRLFVSLFASNILRVSEIVKFAKKYGRKVVLDGRSLHTNVAVAREHGFILADDDQFIETEQMEQYKDSQLAFILTGNQGEPRSSLTRIALEQHRKIKIREGDTVLFSSKFIPGNERKIGNVINHLCRLGAKVIHEKIRKSIHGSGHAHREEIRDMLKYIKPKFYLPVHGEYRHLVSAKELAQELGFSAERILVTENGTAIKLTSAKISLGEPFPGGKVFIDTEVKEVIDDEVIRDRKNMGLHGLIFVSLMVDAKKFRLVGGPEIFCRGFLSEEETHLIAKAENSVRGEVIALLRDLNGDISDIEDVVCRQVRRFFKRETGQRPIIIPSVMAL